MSYIVSAQKATSVNKAISGHFTSLNHISLIVSKIYYLEIYNVNENGLTPLITSRIYGRISYIQLMKRPHNTDLLFLITETNQYCILSYDAENGHIITEFSGNSNDITRNESENGQIYSIDPDLRVVALHSYQGLIQILPIQKVLQQYRNNSLSYRKDDTQSFNLKIKELDVHDIGFLYNCNKPTLAILSREKEHSFLCTYEISVDKKELDGPKNSTEVEHGGKILITLKNPIGGVIVIGEKTITFYDNNLNNPYTIPIQDEITHYGQIGEDDYRYLLSDPLGKIFLLILFVDSNKFHGMKIEQIGETTVPSCISYIDCGYVFIGSHFGDSKLIKLQTEKVGNNYFSVVDEMLNLSPIVDFCVVDIDKHGQSQLVLCSGGYNDGTLRIIKVGVGINEIAKLAIEGLKGIFQLTSSYNSKQVSYIVLSYYKATRFLQFNNNNLSPVTNIPFETEEPTIAVANMLNDNIVQVTSSKIVLYDKYLNIISRWEAPANEKISLSSVNPTQIIVSLRNATLVYFVVENNQIILKKEFHFDNEISCLDITPTNINNNMTFSDICCVGFWKEITLKVINLHTMEVLNTYDLGGDFIPRSIIISKLDDTIYVFVSLGDGQLVCYYVNPNDMSLKFRSKFSLGTQPITLRQFSYNSKNYIFAASDQPTIIYSNNNNLNFSNVNLVDSVIDVCPFTCLDFGDALCILTNKYILVGSINEIQRLHVRTVRLGEHPRRVCYQESTKTLGVICIQYLVYKEEHSFKILDDKTYEILDEYKMQPHEYVQSLLSMKFLNSSKEYYIVGTSDVSEDEEESKSGRILLFSVTGTRQLRIEHSIKISGSPWKMCNFNGHLLASIRNMIYIYKWDINDEGDIKFTYLCRPISGKILPLNICTKGNQIVVGDFMKSITLYEYDETSNEIKEIASDISTRFTNSVCFVDDETYIGSDSNLNIFLLRKNKNPQGKIDEKQLCLVGEYHLGSSINQIKKAKLVTDRTESNVITTNELVFITTDGSIGIIAQLKENIFNILKSFEQNILKIINNIGEFPYYKWRSTSLSSDEPNSMNFIDGDVIESFLELDRESMQKIANGENGGTKLGHTVDELVALVEKLKIMH